MRTGLHALTTRAPHARRRGDLRGLAQATLIALLPCLLLGLYNTGYQANRALAGLGRDAAPGWRGSVLQFFGVGVDAADAAACFIHGAAWFAPLFFVSLAAGRVWESVFARARERPRPPGIGVLAVLFALSLPPGLPLWQAALGFSFGVVLGKEIFGGTGKHFLHPALVGLAFLYFSFPGQMRGDTVWIPVDGHTGATCLALAAAGGLDAILARDVTWMQSFVGRVPGSFGETSALAAVLGALWLVPQRVASWRVLAGLLLGTVATLLTFQWFDSESLPAAGVPWYWHLTAGSFAFGAVFFATDPWSAASTNAGRWIYGAWVGFLIVLIRVANPLHPEGVMLAILLGGAFAPLIDWAVVRANVRRRRRRAHG